MNRKELILAFAAVSLSVACKSGSGGVTNNDSQPSITPQGNLTCADAGQDPNGGTGSALVVCNLDFGGVPIGQSVTTTISFDNNSSSPYNILSLTPPVDPQFTVQTLQYPVQVFQATPLAVSFKPFSEAQLTDSFSVTTDTQAAARIQINLTGSGINIAVAINPTNIDFGKVIIHSTQPKQLTVQNLSTGPITLSPIIPQGIAANLFSIAIANADFAPDGYHYTDPIPPNGTVTFQVTFAPIQPSYADELAYLVVSYASDKYVNVGLTGFGVKSGLSVTTGPIGTNPPQLAFGHIPLNNSVTDFIYVQNISNQTLKLYHSYLSQSDGDVFTVAAPGSQNCPAPMNCQQITPTDGAYTLSPGDKLTYPIIFAPTLGQGYLGAFAVQDDHGDNVTVPIAGGGGGPAISCATLPASAPVPCNGGAGSCLDLAFGDVAVDIGATLSLICTNNGNDITLSGKIDPSAELQVFQAGLLITQPGNSFSASLMVDGLNTSSVALRAGQQFVIQVSYNPQVASTTETATLHIVSNSVLTPSVPVLLSGSGLVLTDCNLTISPIALNFAQLTTGQIAQLPVNLVNNGNNACLINGLSLSPSTDSAFTIKSVSSSSGPDGGALGSSGATPPTSIKLCGTAEPVTDNCSSVYGSNYQVLIQFQPPTSGTYQGVLDFIVSSKSAPAQGVTLAGTAGTGCLIINPQELDFGNVGIKSGSGSTAQYCKTSSRRIRALNTCNTPVIVTGLSNSAQSGDFRISSSPQLPYPLQTGATFDFEEQFEPGTPGAKYGSTTIVAQPSGGVGQSYLAAFHGEASDTREQVDTYTIPAQKVDILWVVDYGNYQSTASFLGLNPYDSTTLGVGLVNSLSSYFDGLGNVDYHIGVVTSIDCISQYQSGQTPADFIANPGPIVGDLQILPCNGCTDASGNAASIITSADKDPVGEMTKIFTDQATNWFGSGIYWESYGCPMSGVPSGQYGENLGCDVMQPALDALTASATTGHNNGFYRSDAALVIVALATGDDGSPYLTGNPVSAYYTYFENLKGFNPLTPFIYNVIGPTAAQFASGQETCQGNGDYNAYLHVCSGCTQETGYSNTNTPVLIQETGGQLVDICTSNWGPALTSLGQTSSAVLTSFTLSGSPVDPPSGLQVNISGVPIPQYTVDGGSPVWTYDPLTDTLAFPNANNAPGPTDVLTITYQNICY